MNCRCQYLLSIFVVLVVSYHGKAQPSSIAGWKMETNAGRYTYTPLNADNNGFVYTLMPLQKENPANLDLWLEQMAKTDLSKNNINVTAKPNSRLIQNIYSYAVTGQTTSGNKRFITYFAYKLPNNTLRVAVFNSPRGNMAVYYNAAASNLASCFKSESVQGQNPQRQAAAEPVPRPITGQNPGAGKLSRDNIQGIALHRETKWAGGMALLSFEPYLLLKDGSLYMYIKDDPYSLDITRSKSTDYKNLGTWQMKGNIITISYTDSKNAVKNETWTKAWWNWAELASPGEKISGSFSAISIGGTGIGGISSAVSKNLSFNNRGQFTQQGSVSSNVQGAGGSAGAYANSNTADTYSIDGYSITFHFNNGTVSRKCFYFYDQDKDMFGMGGSVYTQDKK